MPGMIPQHDSATYLCWLWTESGPCRRREEDGRSELGVNSPVSTSPIFMSPVRCESHISQCLNALPKATLIFLSDSLHSGLQLVNEAS